MESDKNTLKYRRRKAEKAARDLGIPLSRLRIDAHVSDNASLSELQASFSPQAEHDIDFILKQKKMRDDALARLRSTGEVSPSRVDEIDRATTSTKDLVEAVAKLTSEKPEVREQGRKELGIASNADDKKLIEEKQEREEHLLDTTLAVATAAIVLDENATPAPVKTAEAKKEAETAPVAAAPVTTVAAQDIAAVLPEVSSDVVAAATDVNDLGVTLFGISPRVSGGLNTLKAASASSPALATGVKAKKGALEEVISAATPPAAPA